MTKATPTKSDGSYVGVFGDKDAKHSFDRIGKGSVSSSEQSGSPKADKRQAAADQAVFTKEPKAAPVKFRYGRT